MTVLIGILLTIAVFTFVVVIHELGHFMFARIFGVKVYEFGIGIPPKVKKIFTDKKGTEFTINALPIGGFVKMKGEDEEADGDNSDSLITKSIPKQIIIMLGGILFNFILAIVLFSSLFYIGIKPVGVMNGDNSEFAGESLLIPTEEKINSEFIINETGVLLYPVQESLAESFGILNGDILTGAGILKDDIKPIANSSELIEFLENNQNTKAFIEIKRNCNKNLNTCNELGFKEVLINIEIPENSKIGVGIRDNFQIKETKLSLINSIKAGIKETYVQSKFMLYMLGKILKDSILPEKPEDRSDAINSIGGPVAIGGLFTEIAENNLNLKIILILSAMISVNLGVFNLLPIPALDGGRVFMLILNGIRNIFTGGSKVSFGFEKYLNGFFFLILITLMIIITIKDIINL